jgi:hypothetical protein
MCCGIAHRHPRKIPDRVGGYNEDVAHDQMNGAFLHTVLPNAGLDCRLSGGEDDASEITRLVF